MVFHCVRAASMWSKTYGGTGNDNATVKPVQTSDGGYLVAGDTNSFGAGGLDFWLIKTDGDGTMQWNKTYGGTSDESESDMCQTSDGGYALGGVTSSYGAGSQDFWLVKTDAAGNMQWNKTYGGTGSDYGFSVIQTSDGGYAITGETESFGSGGDDVWLVKADASGNMQWNRTYGGIGDDVGRCLIQTGDGGYAMVGRTNSSGAGSNDFWLVKTDAAGNMQWNKTYGGTGDDRNYHIIKTVDGGYAITGYTMLGSLPKAWLVKTDANGNMAWNKTYGGIAEIAMEGIQTSDGGYAIAGYNYLNGQDFLLIKTDSAGNMLWKQTYGGTGLENGWSVVQTNDGGYLLTGFTTSFGAGGTDFWLVKVDESGVVSEGLTLGAMMLLSTVAVIVGRRCFRKRPRFEGCGLGKR